MSNRFASLLLLAAAALLLLGGCTRYAYETVRADPLARESIALDLYLIGDAGKPDRDGEPVLRALQSALARDSSRTFVVFLGDNLYPDGLADSVSAEERALDEWVLATQVDVLRNSGARGIFVPGNHDWQAGGPEGWEAILRQQRWFDTHARGRAELLPRDGCPGPVVRDVGEVLRVVALDTQWWLHTSGPKPVHPESGCATDSPDEVVEGIRAALREAGDRVTLVVGHHPVESGGHHGGYFDWPAYLVPVYPWARRMGWFAPQDVGSAEYRFMRTALERAFATHPPTIYAAGHEHNLQILNGDFARYLVVSGTGIYGHTTAVRTLINSVYARAVGGFMRLSIRPDRWARLSVLVVDEQGNFEEDFSFWIDPRGGGSAPTPPADTTAQ